MMMKVATILVMAMVAMVAMAEMAVAEQTSPHMEALQSVKTAVKIFTFDVFKVLSSTPGNMIVSPLGVNAMLALLLTKAGGRTAQELRTALHLPDDPTAVSLGYKALFDELRPPNTPFSDSSIINFHFFKKVPSAKNTIMVNNSKSEINMQVDFASDPKEAQQLIRSTVEKSTDGKIKNLLVKVDKNTELVVVNTVIVESSWVFPFSASKTKMEPFHTTPTTQVQVPMMYVDGHFGHAPLPKLGAQLVEVPFYGASIKMIFILPDTIDGLARVEENLHTLNFDQINRQMKSGDFILSVPKFQTESEIQLKKTLKKLGIHELFSAANLTGISQQKINMGPMVQNMLLDVSENAVNSSESSGVPGGKKTDRNSSTTFKANHPFLFFIMKKGHSTIFIIGKMMNPKL